MAFKLLKIKTTHANGKVVIEEFGKPQPIQHHASNRSTSGAGIRNARHIGSKLGPQRGPAG